jgi:hypothetical protein
MKIFLNNQNLVNPTWSVDNKKIATIDYDGKITLLKNGNVKVTVQSQEILDTFELTIKQ